MCFTFIEIYYVDQVRLQTMPKPSPGETPMFKGTFDCAYKTLKNEVNNLCYMVLVLERSHFNLIVVKY